MTFFVLFILFLCSGLFIVYTYAGYPFLALLFAKFKEKPIKRAEYTPTISIILAVFNEEKTIVQKVENIRSLDYPQELLEIIIIDDGSTDNTKHVLEVYEDVTLISNKSKGKPSALNTGVAVASGELLVFCDARQTLSKNAFKELSSYFVDPTVGVVSGELVIDSKEGPGAYWKYEKAIRQAEGKWSSIPGATGALFMTKRTLFEPIPEACLLDDVYTPMQLILKGYRVVFEPTAQVFDREVALDREFSRKARTLAGNFQLVEMLPGVLSPSKNSIFFQFLSHKLFRLFCPYALLLLLVSNFLLLFFMSGLWWLFVLFFVAQAGCYGLALLENITGKTGKVGRLCLTFVVLNLAAVVGLIRYLRRDFAWT